MNFLTLNQQAVLGATTQSVTITFLASFLIWIMFAGLIFLWVIDGRIRKEQALHAFAAALLAWLISEMLKSIFPTTRPFMINGSSPLTLTLPADNAFPSSHTAVAFSIATSLFLHNKKLGSFYLILAFLVGLGRVLANVHYVIDIIFGASLGVTTAIVIDRLHLFRFLKVKK